MKYKDLTKDKTETANDLIKKRNKNEGKNGN